LPGSGTEELQQLRARVDAMEAEMAALRQVLAAWAPAKIMRAAQAQAATRSPEAQAPPQAQVAPTPFASAGPAPSGSLESNIGGRLLSKIAILLLLAGAAFFLKWAFDNRWIGPMERVLTGLAAGTGVVVWSGRFRKQTPAFAYTLKAVGTGVLYLSLWASFQLYHQLPGNVALLAMTIVTAWMATLALLEESRLLAAYALTGAYLTPLLLSTGGNHEVFLMVYLATLAAAVGVLLRAREWNILLLGPLPATTVYFIAWYVNWFHDADATRTLWLAGVLWAVLAAVAVAARKADDLLAGVLQPIGAAVFGALTVYSVLVDSGGQEWEAWSALGFAVAYLGLAQVRRGGGLQAAIHLSLAISFVTVAVPLKLTGHGMTVAWLAEALALLWMMRARPELAPRAHTAMRWLGVVTMLLGSGAAVFAPEAHAYVAHAAFLNRDFATAVGAVIALFAAVALMADVPARDRIGHAPAGLIPTLLVLANIVLLVAMHRELLRALAGNEAADFAFSGWIALQGAAMLATGFAKRAALYRWIGLGLLAVTLLKTVLWDMRNLGTGYRVVGYLALGVLLMVVSFSYQKDWLGRQAAVTDNTEGHQA